MCTKNNDEMVYVPEIWCATDRRTDGRTDGRKKSRIEVGAPPKNAVRYV